MNQKMGGDCKPDSGAGVLRQPAISAAFGEAVFRVLQEQDGG
jgi:hypothetical protein